MGNSPRPLSRSSMKRNSINRLPCSGCSPDKVTQRNESEPGEAGRKCDAQARDPPGGHQNGRERKQPEEGTPAAARCKAHQGLPPLRRAPPKREMRHDNHEPHKNAAEKTRSEHV